jgi:hypothetical protein
MFTVKLIIETLLRLGYRRTHTQWGRSSDPLSEGKGNPATYTPPRVANLSLCSMLLIPTTSKDPPPPTAQTSIYTYICMYIRRREILTRLFELLMRFVTYL